MSRNIQYFSTKGRGAVTRNADILLWQEVKVPHRMQQVVTDIMKEKNSDLKLGRPCAAGVEEDLDGRGSGSPAEEDFNGRGVREAPLRKGRGSTYGRK